jgi:hypothetical protein
MSTVGSCIYVDAGALSPSRPQTPAARVRELDPAGSRSPAQRAGEDDEPLKDEPRREERRAECKSVFVTAALAASSSQS